MAAITDTGDIVKPVNVIFQQTLLRNAKPHAPYFIGTMPADLTQHRGSLTAKWRRVENLTPTVSALSELTADTLPTRASVVPSVTDVTATVQKYGQHILLSEETDLANFNGQTDKLVEVLGISAGRSLNMLQRNEAEDNLTIVFAGAVASDGVVVSAITLASIKSVVNTLDRNSAIPFTPMTRGNTIIGSAPILASYWAICHPDVAIDVVGLTGFKSVETYAGHTATEPFEFGYLPVAGRGVRFLMSPDASVDAGSGGTTGSTGLRGSTNIDLYSVPVYGRDALGSVGFGFEHIKETYDPGDKLPGIMLINKGFGSSGVADPFDELASLAWKSWHAAKVLNSTWGRTIRAGATSV
tara:strand:- start:603 stop:1667 length:1065 start_codon:yes stop_codon:yes gene_type:complete